MGRLTGNLDGLNRVQGLPSVEPSSQSRGRKAQIPQLPRHTDAGSVVGSTTVGDILLIGQTLRRNGGGPVAGSVGQYPQ